MTQLAKRIVTIRQQRVMLSSDLAVLYGVAPKVLLQAVKRNRARFPDDFMFQVMQRDFANLKSHSVTSSWGGLRKLPWAFTEQGVAMLSSVLRSQRAIEVNIGIMRAFVRLRDVIADNKELSARIVELEKQTDRRFKVVFAAIEELIEPPAAPTPRRIGFRAPHDLATRTEGRISRARAPRRGVFAEPP